MFYHRQVGPWKHYLRSLYPPTHLLSLTSVTIFNGLLEDEQFTWTSKTVPRKESLVFREIVIIIRKERGEEE